MSLNALVDEKLKDDQLVAPLYILSVSAHLWVAGLVGAMIGAAKLDDFGYILLFLTFSHAMQIAELSCFVPASWSLGKSAEECELGKIANRRGGRKDSKKGFNFSTRICTCSLYTGSKLSRAIRS